MWMGQGNACPMESQGVNAPMEREMTDKHKNLTREELADYVRSCIDAEKQKDRDCAERIVNSTIKQIVGGKLRVRWDESLVVRFRMFSDYPSHNLLREIFTDRGYEFVEIDESFRYFWTVVVSLKQS